jgi:hypothetical protein
MANPDLRHFRNEGLFSIKSDPVEVRYDGEWFLAVWTDKGWFCPDGSKLIEEVKEWRLQSPPECSIKQPKSPEQCPSTPDQQNPKSQPPKRRAVKSEAR